MKFKHLIAITIAIFLVFTACGKKDGTEAPSKSAPSQASSKEVNEINIVFSDQEEYSPGAFTLEKTFAYISGMRYNAASTAKLVYVVFANYEATLGSYGINMPAEPGQIAVVVSFKTANKEQPIEQQMEDYNNMQVATGTYEPAWMGEGECFQVVYYVGGEEGGLSLSDRGASGSATLTTSTPEKVSGSIDFTSSKGSTIKGTFNVKIEKDLWKN